MVFRVLAIVAAAASVAAAQIGSTHTFLPERFYNTFSFAHPPAFRIRPGDRVITKTADAAAWTGTASRSARGPNPQTGPFFVEGAEPGDMLVVSIEKIEINRATAYLEEACWRHMPSIPRAHRTRRARATACDLVARQGKGRGAARRARHPRPRTAVAADARVRRRRAGAQGSNRHHHTRRRLAATWITPASIAGVKVMLPVNEPGALLFIGDGHARQGEGEVVGTGLETSMDVEFTSTLVKKAPSRGHDWKATPTSWSSAARARFCRRSSTRRAKCSAGS